jgi:hypothetical protein
VNGSRRITKDKLYSREKEKVRTRTHELYDRIVVKPQTNRKTA